MNIKQQWTLHSLDFVQKNTRICPLPFMCEVAYNLFMILRINIIYIACGGSERSECHIFCNATGMTRHDSIVR